MLELFKIKKTYKTGDFLQHALKGVNVKFRKNEFTSILGPSGSGKTTLLNIIGGLDRYDEGDLIINGKSTKKFKDYDWDAYRNNSIGFVFQSYNLINHISVLENVEMGMTLSGVSLKKRRKHALEVLKRVGLEEHSHKKPNQLSGGQMQRVAIARALANNPDIILADEPTGALDSKTSVQIMELIKEIAKNKLVIMVTHNSNLANEYSSRIIELKDGEVIRDTNPVTDKDSDSNYSIRKTSMSFLTALKLSFNNIITKKGRTILTAFASSIGIIGIALILSLSNGFDKQITNFETNTLASFPIMINEQAMMIDRNTFRETDEFVEFNDSKKVYSYNVDEARSVHKNIITKDYIDYLEKVDPKLIMGISYTRITNLNILNKLDNNVSLIDNTLFGLSSLPKELESDTFLEKNYDLLEGKLPSNNLELLVEVDTRNRLDENILKILGIDSNSELTISDLIGYEFKLVFNNDYYMQVGNIFIPNNLDDIYDNNNNLTLKIVGAIRPKEGSVFAGERGRYGAVYYQNSLINRVIEVNSKSKIVLSQVKSDINVMSGQLVSDKDQLLVYLGSKDVPIMMNIYPIDFNAKQELLTYLDGYNVNKTEENKVLYTDLAATISNLSSDIMNAITIVLVAFSAISLVVSSIMIGIITYISVIERTKEIGILRALGARKKDVTRVFNAETFIIGFTSGMMGIIITRILIIPINIILYNITTLSNVAQMNIIHITALLIVSIVLTLIGGWIPAKIASKKDPVEALRTE
jgi:putative ABC transport system permease protein